MGYDDTEILAEFLFNSKQPNTDQTSLRITRVFLEDGVKFQRSKKLLSQAVNVENGNSLERLLSCQCGIRSDRGMESGNQDHWSAVTEDVEAIEEVLMSEEERIMAQLGLPTSFAGGELKTSTFRENCSEIIRLQTTNGLKTTAPKLPVSLWTEQQKLPFRYRDSISFCLTQVQNSEQVSCPEPEIRLPPPVSKSTQTAEEKFEAMQTTMLQSLTALRCKWKSGSLKESKFKSVHAKFVNNDAKRRAQKNRKKSTKQFEHKGESDVANDKHFECENSDSEDLEPESIKIVSKDLAGNNCSCGYGEKAHCTDWSLCFSTAVNNNSKLLEKYWCQRYRIFSKFDQGCQLDDESWFSITPEKIAQHHADRCSGDVVLDAFCGSGGNSIQFGFTCEHVISVDIDPEKVSIARHNAQVYGVAQRIDFVTSDFLHLQPFSVDAVFLSPPWGGPSYSEKDVFDCEAMISPPLSALISHARLFSNNVAVLLPKNIDAQQVVNLYAHEGEFVEIEQNFLSNKLKTVTVYLNDLVRFDT